jgi:hypothetical protein
MRTRPGVLSEARRLGEGHPSLATILASMLSVACCLFFTTCGLEDVYYFSPPGFENQSGVLKLTHNTVNTEASFIGYKIYYRVYSENNATAAEDDRTAIVNAAGLETATPEGILSKMTSLGFKPIYINSQLNEPLPLLKPKSTSVAEVFSIHYPTASDWYYLAPGDDEETILADPTTYADHFLVRYPLKSDVTSLESFNSAYSVSDPDYDSTIASESRDNVNFVFFAIAYGFDITKSIYSLPADLGSVIAGYTIQY